MPKTLLPPTTIWTTEHQAEMSDQNTPSCSNGASLKQEAIIAEYTSLREEIAGRTRDQLVCVTASLVAIGALLSTVATDPIKFSGLLVVAPWILTVFGILWCDHAHAVHMIAAYLRDEIEQKKLRQLPGAADLPETIGWETYLQNKR